MSEVDRVSNIQRFDEVDNFINTEFKKADEKGQVCFFQVAEEPGFSRIVGIKIRESQTA